MSRNFYRGIRCDWQFRSGRYCNRLFMDWADYKRHLRRHRRALRSHRRVARP